MKPVAAGLEVLSGCFALFGLGGSALVFLVLWFSHRKTVDDDKLIRMMQDFIVGHDQSPQHVEDIHYFLMTRFPGNYRYSEATSAAGSYRPRDGEVLNEFVLGQAFCQFLLQRYGLRFEMTMQRNNAWPPQPKR